MAFPVLALWLGCGLLDPTPELPIEQQRRLLIGPVAHAWRDLARAQADPAEAAVVYRDLAQTLRGIVLSEPDDLAWRDLLVSAAERDAAWGEALGRGEAVPVSTLGPVSKVRSALLAKAPPGQVTAEVNALLQEPPWKNWNALLTPWLETARYTLDATPPFDVDAHWGPWLPREANRQVASLAYADQRRGPPRAFVARMQHASGPAEPRSAGGCDLYQDVAGEGGPKSGVGPGPTQSQHAGELLTALAERDAPRAVAAVSVLVAARDPSCPGAALFEAGLVGRILLAEGDPGARAHLQRAVEVGRGLLAD